MSKKQLFPCVIIHKVISLLSGFPDVLHEAQQAELAEDESDAQFYRARSTSTPDRRMRHERNGSPTTNSPRRPLQELERDFFRVPDRRETNATTRLNSFDELQRYFEESHGSRMDMLREQQQRYDKIMRETNRNMEALREQRRRRREESRQEAIRNIEALREHQQLRREESRQEAIRNIEELREQQRRREARNAFREQQQRREEARQETGRSMIETLREQHRREEQEANRSMIDILRGQHQRADETLRCILCSGVRHCMFDFVVAMRDRYSPLQPQAPMQGPSTANRPQPPTVSHQSPVNVVHNSPHAPLVHTARQLPPQVPFTSDDERNVRRRLNYERYVYSH